MSRVRSTLSKYYGLKKGADDPAMDVSIDGAGFDSEDYVRNTFKSTNLSDMVTCTDNMRSEIRKLDDGMQMLVYDNYNKFIEATDTIRNMKGKMDKFEPSIQGLDSKMNTIRAISAQVNDGLSERRTKIEELHTVRSLLTKLQFLVELPGYIQKCNKEGHWVQAVQAYTQAVPYLDKYANKFKPFAAVHQEVTATISALKSRMEAKLEQGTNAQGGEISLMELQECVQLLLDLNKDPLLLRAMFISSQQQGLARRLVRVKHEVTQSSTAVDRIGGISKVYLSEFRDLADAYDALFNPSAAMAAGDPSAHEQLIGFSKEALGLYFDAVRSEAARDGVDPNDLLEALGTLVVDTNFLDELVQGARIKQLAQQVVSEALRSRVTRAFERNKQMISECLQQFDRAVGSHLESDSDRSPEHLALCHREFDKFTVGMQTALRNLSSFTDARNELLAPFREDVIIYLKGYAHELFGEIGRASISIGEAILRDGVGEGLSAVQPPYLLLAAQLVHKLADRGVSEVDSKMQQHCGKHEDGTAVCLPDTLKATLCAQRDSLVKMYVTIEGQQLSGELEHQVLFNTEWHQPNDGEGEAVLARLVTHKMMAVSKVLEALAPNPKFIKLPWRQLRGHVKFYNVHMLPLNTVMIAL
eukprot:TRINITY_DN7131_c0_g2_i4.p1 TRINITY_DN7131_c0_g2~~TRINITY_DN7131_c0_g2_i4.p1  ORF type:complete len:642 (+),score=208.01 TRINITY_DN7131_c0_g2_i4:191-2116(+)